MKNRKQVWFVLLQYSALATGHVFVFVLIALFVICVPCDWLRGLLTTCFYFDFVAPALIGPPACKECEIFFFFFFFLIYSGKY